MQMVRDILMYMDRTFVSFNKKMPVYEMGLVVFRDAVARHEKVKGRLQALILQVPRGGVTGLVSVVAHGPIPYVQQSSPPLQ